jgi:hypothetical protein
MVCALSCCSYLKEDVCFKSSANSEFPGAADRLSGKVLTYTVQGSVFNPQD